MLIHRSIFKELLVNFLIVISFLSFVLFMEKFVRITKLILGKGVELMDFIKVFLFLQPSILLLSLPMAILITVFLLLPALRPIEDDRPVYQDLAQVI